MGYGEERIDGFLKTLASAAPVPGGGSVAALVGALGASLLTMVGEITMKKKKPEDKTAITEALEKLGTIRRRLVALADEDAAAFERVMAAFKMPKDDEAQKEARRAVIEEATVGAAEVPLETVRTSLDALAAGAALAELGARSAISDVACGAVCLEAAAAAAVYNVRINLAGLRLDENRARLEGALAEVEARRKDLRGVRAKAEERLG